MIEFEWERAGTVLRWWYRFGLPAGMRFSCKVFFPSARTTASGSRPCIGKLRNEPVGRDSDTFRLGLMGVLEEDLAAVSFFVIDLHDAGTGGFVHNVQDEDGLAGSEYHGRRLLFRMNWAG
jgi:hypothetical protein